MNRNENEQFRGLTKRVYYLADLVIQNRLIKALKEGAARYPVYRELRLTGAEAQALAEEIAAGDAEKLTRASLALAAEEGQRRSVAEIYRALR